MNLFKFRWRFDFFGFYFLFNLYDDFGRVIKVVFLIELYIIIGKYRYGKSLFILIYVIFFKWYFFFNNNMKNFCLFNS